MRGARNGDVRRRVWGAGAGANVSIGLEHGVVEQRVGPDPRGLGLREESRRVIGSPCLLHGICAKGDFKDFSLLSLPPPSLCMLPFVKRLLFTVPIPWSSFDRHTMIA